MVLGLIVGVAGAFASSSKLPPLRWLVRAYVEFIRNTPFLVQLFFIYFSLPVLGIRLTPFSAAIVAMVINFGAYAVEIIRAGVDAVPTGQREAAAALGLSRIQTFVLVILKPAMGTVYPALSSQFIILFLSSSLLSAISVQELTGVTNGLQSTTFRSFEFYFVSAGIYLVMALGVRWLLAGIYRNSFRWAQN